MTQRILKKLKELNTLWHPKSGLVFKSVEEKKVIGMYENKTLTDFDSHTLELCKKWGFKYDEEKYNSYLKSIEDSDDSSVDNQDDKSVSSNEGEKKEESDEEESNEEGEEGEESEESNEKSNEEGEEEEKVDDKTEEMVDIDTSSYQDSTMKILEDLKKNLVSVNNEMITNFTLRIKQLEKEKTDLNNKLVIETKERKRLEHKFSMMKELFN